MPIIIVYNIYKKFITTNIIYVDLSSLCCLTLDPIINTNKNNPKTTIIMRKIPKITASPLFLGCDSTPAGIVYNSLKIIFVNYSLI